MPGKVITRRQMLGSALAAAAGFMVLPRNVLGGPGQMAPSDELTRAVIGTGGRGGGFCHGHMVAACDVDTQRFHGPPEAERVTDFRRVLDRKDVDVVYIGTPPHWHALITIAAMQAGKDVYCEKPMTKFIAEGRAVVNAVKRYGRIFQIGTFGRFGVRPNDRTRKIMKSGFIKEDGPVHRHSGGWKVGEWSGRVNPEPEPIPPNLDYDMWLGPAPFKPYHKHRVHGSFRGYWDYDGGGLADMGQHYLDGPQYLYAKDDTGPVEVEASAPFPPHPDAVQMWGWVSLKYADGTTLIFESNEWGGRCPIENRGIPPLTPEQEQQLAEIPDDPPMYGNGEGGFEQAVRLRKECGGNAEAAHRCATLLHLANIAIRLGRKLNWDPVAEQFLGDDEANKFVDIPMRAPWHL